MATTPPNEEGSATASATASLRSLTNEGKTFPRSTKETKAQRSHRVNHQARGVGSTLSWQARSDSHLQTANGTWSVNQRSAWQLGTGQGVNYDIRTVQVHPAPIAPDEPPGEGPLVVAPVIRPMPFTAAQDPCGFYSARGMTIKAWPTVAVAEETASKAIRGDMARSDSTPWTSLPLNDDQLEDLLLELMGGEGTPPHRREAAASTYNHQIESAKKQSEPKKGGKGKERATVAEDKNRGDSDVPSYPVFPESSAGAAYTGSAWSNWQTTKDRAKLAELVKMAREAVQDDSGIAQASRPVVASGSRTQQQQLPAMRSSTQPAGSMSLISQGLQCSSGQAEIPRSGIMATQEERKDSSAEQAAQHSVAQATAASKVIDVPPRIQENTGPDLPHAPSRAIDIAMARRMAVGSAASARTVSLSSVDSDGLADGFWDESLTPADNRPMLLQAQAGPSLRSSNTPVGAQRSLSPQLGGPHPQSIAPSDTQSVAATSVSRQTTDSGSVDSDGLSESFWDEPLTPSDNAPTQWPADQDDSS